MKIKNWMNSSVVTIGRTASIQDAIQLMKAHAIRHLPVVEDDQLVGLITESDMRHYAFPTMAHDIAVHQLMTLNPISINANSSIETAARLIHDYKISGLPVLDKKKLVGIITASDLLSAFIEIMGLLKSSSRLDVIIEKKGGLAEVTKIIKQHRCEIISVATESQSSRRKIHYFRLEKCNLDPVVQALDAAGHKVISVMD